MSDAAERFQTWCAQRGLHPDVATYPHGTRTAEDAAAAVGCDVAQIVKSLVFMAVSDDGDVRPILALTSGAHRADTTIIATALAAARVRKADADEARAATGYAIGGTPPFGHDHDLTVLMDPGLLDHDTVWAAAGTPTTVFPIDPSRLRELSAAQVLAFGH